MPEPMISERIGGGVNQPRRHDSAWKHVSGSATYIDDVTPPAGLLHVYLGISSRAHARIKHINLEPVRQAPGVVLVLTAADVSGVNDVSPTHRHDEPLLATTVVEYAGQPLFAVAASTRDQARRAARLAVVEYEDLPALLDVEAAGPDGRLVTDPLTLQRGDAKAALARAPHRITGKMAIGGQDHFYLEGQIAMAIPGEDDEVTVLSSTQHPSEIQHMVALVLGVPNNAVTVECRRMGGAFGGKETQGNLFACVAAIVAKKTGRAAKIRPDRDDDMVITGKRHDFMADYAVGFDDDGRIQARRHHLRRALRLLRGSVRAGDRPGAVPRRQLLLLRGRAPALAAAQDEYGLEHRVPRLRRPAGHGRGRAADRGDRLRARQGPARDQENQLLWRGPAQHHALPPDGRGQRHRRDRRRARAERRLLGPPRRRSASRTQKPGDQARPRADPGQVRDLLHRDPIQSGGRSGPRLYRRLASI